MMSWDGRELNVAEQKIARKVKGFADLTDGERSDANDRIFKEGADPKKVLAELAEISHTRQERALLNGFSRGENSRADVANGQSSTPDDHNHELRIAIAAAMSHGSS